MQESELRELFNQIDADRTERVSLREFKLHLASQGIFVTRKEEQLLMDSHMDWPSFRAWAFEKQRQLKDVFQALDTAGDGSVSLTELQDACRIAGISADEVQRMMRHADTDKDGVIKFDEFFELVRHNHFHLELDGSDPSSVLEHLRQRAANMALDDEVSLMVDFQNSGGKLRNLAAAFSAACISRTIVAPLDRIQCLLQVPTYLQKGLVCPTTGIVTYNTTVKEALSAAVQQSGLRGLWRGNMVNLTRLVPEIALRSYLFEHLKSAVAFVAPETPTSTHLEVHHRWIAATSAAVIAYGIGYPISVIKTQLQTTERRTTWDLVKGTLNRQSGIGAFYRGMCPSLIRIATDAALYEAGKSLFTMHVYPHIAKKTGERPSLGSLFFVATAATTVSQLLTYPLLLARTRMQVSSLELTKDVLPHSRFFTKYPALFSTFKHIVREEGFRGLYRGALVNAVKVVPVGAMTLLGYEAGKRVFGVSTVF